MSSKVERFIALDMLRGLTMIIMALDHARDFFALGWVYYAPTDIAITNFEVFFTRWITHFAAPTFIFLAGVGLFFASGRRSKTELASLAISRGLWLIFLELTLVGFFWSFNSEFIFHPKVAVLFVIGLCMIVMGVLIYLPKPLIAFIALSMVFGHNFLDSYSASDFGSLSWLWLLAHESGVFTLGPFEVRVVYPFIPWVGVMALGYLFGPVTKMPRVQRKKIFFSTGLGLFIFGVMLRYSNIYGDPSLWQSYDSFEQTLMSFMNLTKYPPSFLFLSIFLGLAMMLMAVLDRELGSWSKILQDFGEVPFFFYILHLPLLHLGGILLALFTFSDASWLYGAPIKHSPQGYSYFSELAPTYIAWFVAVALLYPPSRWFARLKHERKDWWLSYL
jgi:uncharacterized membrane protein